MVSLFIFTLKLSETKLTASVLKLDQNTEKAEREKRGKKTKTKSKNRKCADLN